MILVIRIANNKLNHIQKIKDLGDKNLSSCKCRKLKNLGGGEADITYCAEGLLNVALLQEEGIVVTDNKPVQISGRSTHGDLQRNEP